MIKAQSAAIYRKVRVSNRTELVFLMVDERIGRVQAPVVGAEQAG